MYTELLQACFDHDSPEAAASALLGEANALLIDRRVSADLQQADLLDRWGQVLDQLELLLALCESVGRSYGERYGDEARTQRHLSFAVLAKLGLSSYRVGGEILTLLKAGYTNGALARWRTLHEIDVVSRFIAMHRGEVAERFLAHEDFRRRQGRHEVNRISRDIGIDLSSEMRRLRGEDDALVRRYGDVFRGEYGWAHEALIHNDDTYRRAIEQRPGNGRRGPSFADIDRFICGNDGSRLLYRLASYGVHATAGLSDFMFSGGSPDDPDAPRVLDAPEWAMAELARSVWGPTEVWLTSYPVHPRVAEEADGRALQTLIAVSDVVLGRLGLPPND